MLKNKHKLLLKVLKITYKQEFQLSTDDLSVYLELDRDASMNQVDFNNILKHKHKSQSMNKVKTIEIEAEEYY